MTIKLQVLDVQGNVGGGRGEADRVLLAFDRPGRTEITVRDGKMMIFVYEGTTIDMDQEPLLAYEPANSTLSVGDSLTA